jgi:hypothetical protein
LDVKNLNDKGISKNLKDYYYAKIIFNNTRESAKFITIVLYRGEFAITTIQSIFKLPKDVAKLLLYRILELDDYIDIYGEVTLPKLLKYLTIGDNLNNFIRDFKLILLTSEEYSEIEIARFINNFLTIIQP